ncbi:hypothetical protein EGW08_014111 [Elysia chlorotica]|uniref:VWFA domain-containing protein n=1 Tax=Elysia chlorotica TaxID=188477 RepID=A0A433T9C0_ELYCH|nr:hypothetical protein EGW08_014111 [Elysia chlorotica]
MFELGWLNMKKLIILLAVLLAAVAHGFELPRARSAEPEQLSDATLECREKPVELGIVLDSSKSIWLFDFLHAIKFLQDLVSYFDIGPTKTRVALISFGDGVHIDQAFNLTTYKSGKEIKAAIGDVEHQIGLYTSTWEAIDFMRDHQLDVTHVRPGLKKVAVVVTDGNSQEGKKTAAAASKAVEQDINMIAVGVGKWVNDQELENIAGGNSNMVIRADNFPRLMEVLGTLRTKICQPNE